jgi:hypothetical protein
MKLSQKLKLEHDSGDCGGYLEGFAEMAEALENSKPKIKMTKTLPSEAGQYYYSPNTHLGNIKILTLSEGREAGDFITDSSWFARASELRGYWAKVDESMFEFED